MNALTKSNTLKALSILGITVGLLMNQSASATEHETACKANIQGKIAWKADNYESSSKWEEANLDALCKGTTQPKESGECFHKVMIGHVKWGVSDKWEWKNAISLCAGSNDSEKTINCFKGRLADGEKWDTAIFQCQSNSKSLNNVAPEK